MADKRFHAFICEGWPSGGAYFSDDYLGPFVTLEEAKQTADEAFAKNDSIEWAMIVELQGDRLVRVATGSEKRSFGKRISDLMTWENEP